MGQPTWQQVSDRFLAFFGQRGHTIVPGSSLIPGNDPTLLFTNAGMVQFKDVFLGTERRAYTRAATLQKCMRVQGKHNDLDNVGPSPRHHTLFFMLGNFSFGDYFKDDAVAYAWELLTRGYGLDPDRLIITVLHSDDDAVAAWRRLGVPDARILRLGETTNFWMMGDVGPCGPTSELHYDWGPAHCTCGRPDCSVALDNGCLRWLEIWNLVFMQFDQAADGTRTPLPRPGVDTGLGLERMTSVLQGVNDDYGTDLFAPLIRRIAALCGQPPSAEDRRRVPYRVMADHARAMTFLMGDGVVPGNEGRGYALRMIMRRAIRFGRSVGLTGPFLAQLAEVVIGEMGTAYPDLVRQRAFIVEAAGAEEARFAQTLSSGLQRLEEVLAAAAARGEQVIPGSEVFRLYDTYGFPVEMTRDVARERGFALDEAGFAAAMAAQRERARAAQMFAVGAGERRYAALAAAGVRTEFVGYTRLRARGKVLALWSGGAQVADATAGAEVEVVLDRTPFYAEAGGQVGDQGLLVGGGARVEVTDTRRPAGEVIVHLGRLVRGRLRVGQTLTAQVDAARRADIMRNHTATHLLHRALQEVLGEHARQAGSLVAPDRLRFDYVHLSPLTAEQRERIERRVNEKILEDLPVRPRWMSYTEAMALGAMALFGEKYGDRVRVISIDGYSRELCGGTHLRRTSQIGLFKITGEGSVAAGVRRIEAVTGRGVYELLRRQEGLLADLADQLKSAPEELPDRVRRLAERIRELERARQAELLGQVKQALAARALDRAVAVRGLLVAAEPVNADRPELLRALSDAIRREFGRQAREGVVVLVSEATGQIVATRTPEVTVDMGRFVRTVAGEFGGSGGGRPEFGQGGLKDGSRVHELVDRLHDPEFVERLLVSVG